MTDKAIENNWLDLSFTRILRKCLTGDSCNSCVAV